VANAKHCTTQFKPYSSYKQHLMDVHSECTWHSCEFCDKKFLLQGDLNSHLRVHGGVKPYVCNECRVYFWTAGELKRHQFYKHDGKGRYFCGFCCREFYYKSEVKKHLPHCTAL